LVICCVLRMELIRLRMTLSVAMCLSVQVFSYGFQLARTRNLKSNI
jgi:hypothetical protein